MNVSLLPALIEVVRLLFWIVLVTGLVVAFVWLNYKTWRSRLYMPGCMAVGCLAAYLFTAHVKYDPTVILSLYAFFTGIGAFFKYALAGRYRSPIYFAAPACVAVFLLFMYPLVFEFYLAFHSLNLTTLKEWIDTGNIRFAGIENFGNVFEMSRVAGESTWDTFRLNFIDVLGTNVGTKDSFWRILVRTFLWTGVNLFFHVTFGLGLALLLNQRIRFVNVYRTLLILPWAIPQLIAVLAWRGEFHFEYGYVNHLVRLMGLEPMQWLTKSSSLFAAVCIVNVWLGVPFMMIVSLSALQGIPKSYYEAASIDGASRWQQFRAITLPLLKPVLVPAVILGMIWTFNNVNVIYLMTAQNGGSEGADILVSDLYKQAFNFNRYSFSAAYAIVIFCILLALTVLWLRASRVADDPAR